MHRLYEAITLINNTGKIDTNTKIHREKFYSVDNQENTLTV